MEYRLDFLNPVWHYGANITMRLGKKWKDKNLEDYVDKVVLYRTGGKKPVAEGMVERSVYKPFNEVTIQDLWEEHDPECRTPDGLVKAMLRAYDDFTLASMVTVIRFII